MASLFNQLQVVSGYTKLRGFYHVGTVQDRQDVLPTYIHSSKYHCNHELIQVQEVGLV